MNDTTQQQYFKVETEDGKILDAELITVLDINENKYAVYAIDNGDTTAQLFASKIITNDNGETTLVDIENNAEKEEIIKNIKEKLNN